MKSKKIKKKLNKNQITKSINKFNGWFNLHAKAKKKEKRKYMHARGVNKLLCM